MERECVNGGDNITRMATLQECQIVRDAVRGLCDPLTQAVERSWELADNIFVDMQMPESDHRGGRAHLARHLLRRELRRADDLGGWKLPGRCTPNAEVKLVRGAMSLKVLRPGLLGAVPHPGPNRARVRYYENPQLNLFGADGSNLIAVWTVDLSTGEPQIRLVRTVGQWKALKQERIDIDFYLPRVSGDLDELEFVPSDEEFPLPFDEELGGESDDGGPTSW